MPGRRRNFVKKFFVLELVQALRPSLCLLFTCPTTPLRRKVARTMLRMMLPGRRKTPESMLLPPSFFIVAFVRTILRYACDRLSLFGPKA